MIETESKTTVNNYSNYNYSVSGKIIFEIFETLSKVRFSKKW